MCVQSMLATLDSVFVGQIMQPLTMVLLLMAQRVAALVACDAWPCNAHQG